MGQLFACCKKTKGGGKHHPKTVYIQVLVVGDSQVGKSTLVNNYVSEQQEVTFETVSEMIRIINAVQVVQDPNNPDFFTTANVTIIDVEGSSENMNQQLRNSYYTTSQIVLVLFNIQNNISLYNAKKNWQKEIDEATLRVNDRASLCDVQLVLVGVNPEARDQFTVMNENEFITVDDDSDDESVKLFRSNSARSSVNKKTAESVATGMGIRDSQRRTKYPRDLE